ncbi:MAG: hypothetical protein R3F61_31440 [Myxococcota bacterium]
MRLSILLVLTACSEYGLDNDPAEHDLSVLDDLTDADGTVPWEGLAELDIPSVDITVGETPDEPSIPGVSITIDDDPGALDETPTIPGVDITFERTPREPEDEYRDDACDGGIFVDFAPGEIYVLSWNDTEAFGEITVPTDGVYEIWNTSIAESGGSQRNESGFVLVPNALNPSGEPLFANCDGVRILDDADNDGPLPAGTTRYVGTFPLEAGVNLVEFHHYCPLYRTGACTQFHDSVDSSKTCDSDNVNSVHFMPEQLCLYPL